MAKNKNISIIISFLLILLTMVGCANQQKESRFPTDESGYPKDDVMMINGTEEELPDLANTTLKDKFTYRVTAKPDKDGLITIILPKASAVNFWCIEENVLVTSYQYETLLKDTEEKAEGSSDAIQIFKFSSAPNCVVKLKWVNINEIEKAFSDREENYLLEIEIEE